MPKYEIVVTIDAPDMASAAALILYPDGDPVQHIDQISELIVSRKTEQTDRRDFKPIPARAPEFPSVRLTRDTETTDRLEAQADVG